MHPRPRCLHDTLVTDRRDDQLGIHLPLVSTTARELGGSGACRVLVVDDNRDAADTLALVLDAMGCVVDAEYTGEQALRRLEHFHPALVLLDLGLPGLSGYEVCRRIRVSPEGARPLVVAITGWGHDETRRATRSAGFDRHLVKPVPIDVLERVVRDASVIARLGC